MSLKCLFFFPFSPLNMDRKFRIADFWQQQNLTFATQSLSTPYGGSCINSSHPQQSHDFTVFSQQYDWTCCVPPWKAVLYPPVRLIPHLPTTMQGPRAIYRFLSMCPNWGFSDGPIHQQGICRGLGRHWSYFSTPPQLHHTPTPPKQKKKKKLHYYINKPTIQVILNNLVQATVTHTKTTEQ